jgi:hypothetical protein
MKPPRYGANSAAPEPARPAPRGAADVGGDPNAGSDLDAGAGPDAGAPFERASPGVFSLVRLIPGREAA